MLYYDRIDFSKGIDVNNRSESKDCNILHFWYFLDYGFKFQPNVFNGCHDLLMKSMNLSDITILNNNGADYYCIIRRINKSGSINLMENISLTEKNKM